MIMIETSRLFLREMGPEDFDALYAVLADSDIMQHYPYTFDEARVQNWINKNIERYRVSYVTGGFSFFIWSLQKIYVPCFMFRVSQSVRLMP